MNKNIVKMMIYIALYFIALAEATTINLQPIGNYNSITNTLIISISSFNAMTLDYGQSVNFVFNGLTIANVIEINSSNTTVVRSVSSITAPVSNLPHHVSVSIVNGESPLFVNNVSIQPPPSFSNSISIVPSSIVQAGNFNPAPNISFSYLIENIPLQNQIFRLLPGQNLTDNLGNKYFAPPKWNFANIISPSWTNSLTIVNSLYGASITVTQIPLINQTFNVIAGNMINISNYGFSIRGIYPDLGLRKHIGYGQNYSLFSVNSIFYAQPFTVNTINNSVLSQWYQINVADNCLNTTTVYNADTYNASGNIIVHGSPIFTYCSKLKNQTGLNIFAICVPLNFQGTNGLTQCLNTILQTTNGTGTSYKHLYLNEIALYNKTGCNTDIINVCAGSPTLYSKWQTNSSIISGSRIQGDQVGFVVSLVIGIAASALGLYTYLSRKNRLERTR